MAFGVGGVVVEGAAEISFGLAEPSEVPEQSASVHEDMRIVRIGVET